MSPPPSAAERPAAGPIPIWLRTEVPACRAWLHVPNAGDARGAVVIVPSLGTEFIAAYPTLRVLAERAANAGFVAMRVHLTGTGDSGGSLTDASLDGWVADIGDAVSTVRRKGADHVAVVALRVGAAIPDHALDRR